MLPQKVQKIISVTMQPAVIRPFQACSELEGLKVLALGDKKHSPCNKLETLPR